ncbi:hypothetical protein NIES2101_13515 [Calothrix sp. HK-06]|nr:hypothetical protein NIES2101_13515 [Calothrix sp. HK-06]
MQEENRTIETLGKIYELRPYKDGIVVEILGTCYEIYEREQNFNVYRIDPDGIAICCGEQVNSLVAAIELAEIFERLIYYATNTGLIREFNFIQHFGGMAVSTSIQD